MRDLLTSVTQVPVFKVVRIDSMPFGLPGLGSEPGFLARVQELDAHNGTCVTFKNPSAPRRVPSKPAEPLQHRAGGSLNDDVDCLCDP